MSRGTWMLECDQRRLSLAEHDKSCMVSDVHSATIVRGGVRAINASTYETTRLNARERADFVLHKRPAAKGGESGYSRAGFQLHNAKYRNVEMTCHPSSPVHT